MIGTHCPAGHAITFPDRTALYDAMDELDGLLHCPACERDFDPVGDDEAGAPEPTADEVRVT